jgi:hypothetical protein
MSLINEALKKAQRQRTESHAGAEPTAPGGDGARIAKRAQPRSARTLLLISAGALALVVTSVIVTILFVNGSDGAAPPPAVGPASPSTSPAPAVPIDPAAAPAPPLIVAAEPVPPAPITAAPAAAGDGPIPAAPAVPLAAAAEITAAVPPDPVPNAAIAAQPAEDPSPAKASPATPPTQQRDERVYAFIETIRVTGIRSSGDDSRVLMNNRVYRVNDIVERNLGIRLIQVEVDSLTFADAHGQTYTKHF